MVPDAAGWRHPGPHLAGATARGEPACPCGGRVRQAAPGGGYFLLRRWMRVFFSNLRCFFLAILLRRFLMTEPTELPSLDCTEDGHATVPAPMRAAGHRPGVEGYRADHTIP
jgi:hypothetical protein